MFGANFTPYDLPSSLTFRGVLLQLGALLIDPLIAGFILRSVYTHSSLLTLSYAILGAVMFF